MIIHKSHSKNDLVKIIESLHIKVPNPRKYKKVELSALLSYELNTVDEIELPRDSMFLNIIDLKYFLTSCNPSKILTVKEKNNVINICKKIKHFSRNGFDINITDYKSLNHLFTDANYIKEFGSIPSVRKSLKELNKYPDKPYEWIVNIPPHIKMELDKKDKLKKAGLFQFTKTIGEYVITFD
tara:strand:+ start:14608 stop:15156 length:549 start_codon:yes stop_codon:yes gene_type:complete